MPEGTSRTHRHPAPPNTDNIGALVAAAPTVSHATRDRLAALLAPSSKQARP